MVAAVSILVSVDRSRHTGASVGQGWIAITIGIETVCSSNYTDREMDAVWHQLCDSLRGA